MQMLLLLASKGLCEIVLNVATLVNDTYICLGWSIPIKVS